MGGMFVEVVDFCNYILRQFFAAAITVTAPIIPYVRTSTDMSNGSSLPGERGVERGAALGPGKAESRRWVAHASQRGATCAVALCEGALRP